MYSVEAIDTREYLVSLVSGEQVKASVEIIEVAEGGCGQNAPYAN